MRLLALLLTSALFGCTSEAPVPISIDEEDSRRALEAALIHLDQHLKAESAGPEGVLLLEPTSHVWSAESLQSFSADPKDECIIPNGMYARVIAATPKEEPVAELVSPSSLWLMPAELPKPDRLIPISELNGVKVRTIVTISRPGFSENGHEALVILRFTWSIHDALARVRLRRAGSNWQPQCAQFNFYV